MRNLIYFVLITSLLAACGEKEPRPQGVLSSGQEKVLKDAKGVENKLLEADQARRKNLEGTAE